MNVLPFSKNKFKILQFENCINVTNYQETIRIFIILVKSILSIWQTDSILLQVKQTNDIFYSKMIKALNLEYPKCLLDAQRRLL